MSKPTVKLIGENGNIFVLVAKAAAVLKRAGQKDQAKELQERLFQCANYDAALCLIQEYVEVE